MPKNVPTLHDVARLAGVSYQTVSRVINGERYVAVDTLERVQKAIAELNYRPNRAARSLITRQSGTIQIIVFDLGSLFALRALLDTAQGQGYGALLSVLKEHHSVDELRQVINESVSRQVDGILLMMPWIDVGFAELQRFAHGAPLVVVGADLGEGTPSVLIDQQAGAQLALEHILAHGHRRVGEISGLTEVYYDAQMRHQATVAGMQAQGASLSSAAGDFTLHGGYRAAQQLLDEHPDITALLCANDETAFGALRALRERGRRVPADVSVIGFDDLPMAAYSEPPLTTVRQDFAALGRLGMESLIETIREPGKPTMKGIIAPKLVIRQSTARARE